MENIKVKINEIYWFCPKCHNQNTEKIFHFISIVMCTSCDTKYFVENYSEIFTYNENIDNEKKDVLLEENN